MVSETLREVTSRLDDGRYSVVSTLKEGRLYIAERAGRRVVLKTAAGAKGLEMLKREYELSIRLQHPFIASAIAWEEDSPVGPAIVMEYIRGRSLTAYLKERPPLKARQRVFGQLLEAVGAIHRQSIVHNDIKPDNILITEADDDVKLIDFGYADGDSNFLEKGLGGTRSYASPELLAHRETDARSDIYSIGCLMRDIFPGRYRAIAGKCRRSSPGRRFANIDELKKAWAHRNRPLLAFWILPAAALAAGLYWHYATGDGPATPAPESAEPVPAAAESTAAPGPVAAPAAAPKPIPALAEAETALRKAWEDTFLKVCREMDQAGYVEFLPIHVDYGTYDIDPVLRRLSSGLSPADLKTLLELDDALNMDYSRRLYARYGALPSLYGKDIALPADELEHYRGLVAGFKKFSPYEK